MKTSRQFIAVVPAAGSGTRMKADKPKQYLEINGKTILEHTLNVLLTYPAIQRIIVAVAKDDPYINQMSFLPHPKIQLIEGGEDRATSVLNGLNAMESTSNDT